MSKDSSDKESAPKQKAKPSAKASPSKEPKEKPSKIIVNKPELTKEEIIAKLKERAASEQVTIIVASDIEHEAREDVMTKIKSGSINYSNCPDPENCMNKLIDKYKTDLAEYEKKLINRNLKISLGGSFPNIEKDLEQHSASASSYQEPYGPLGQSSVFKRRARAMSRQDAGSADHSLSQDKIKSVFANIRRIENYK
uniref:Uncharacterized protein n=1 Tax=Euplotes harpa TaxID=151035 RepID=A0A7S3JH88_9SPIT